MSAIIEDEPKKRVVQHDITSGDVYSVYLWSRDVSDTVRDTSIKTKSLQNVEQKFSLACWGTLANIGYIPTAEEDADNFGMTGNIFRLDQAEPRLLLHNANSLVHIFDYKQMHCSRDMVTSVHPGEPDHLTYLIVWAVKISERDLIVRIMMEDLQEFPYKLVKEAMTSFKNAMTDSATEPIDMESSDEDPYYVIRAYQRIISDLFKNIQARSDEVQRDFRLLTEGLPKNQKEAMALMKNAEAVIRVYEILKRVKKGSMDRAVITSIMTNVSNQAGSSGFSERTKGRIIDLLKRVNERLETVTLIHFKTLLRDCFDPIPLESVTHHAIVAFDKSGPPKKFDATINQRQPLLGTAGQAKSKRRREDSAEAQDDQQYATVKQFKDLMSLVGQVVQNTNPQKENQGQGRQGNKFGGFNNRDKNQPQGKNFSRDTDEVKESANMANKTNAHAKFARPRFNCGDSDDEDDDDATYKAYDFDCDKILSRKYSSREYEELDGGEMPEFGTTSSECKLSPEQSSIISSTTGKNVRIGHSEKDTNIVLMPRRFDFGNNHDEEMTTSEYIAKTPQCQHATS